ncbi:MAG: GlcG/HbpS family heme-binding protein [Bacteroidales bacterium]
MEKKHVSESIDRIILGITDLIPDYTAIDDDFRISNGNVAICIIDESGTVSGKLFGTNKIRFRESYRIAWIKASQVWITGFKTGEYEKLIFANQINEDDYGISRPDMIGWEGGQPVTLKDGTRLSIGFSGFRGTSDLEIVVKAIQKANL